jgi:hypothetical protein
MADHQPDPSLVLNYGNFPPHAGGKLPWFALGRSISPAAVALSLDKTARELANTGFSIDTGR